MPSVLITGASRGIGFETALAFARAGYQVHATMRNPSASPALAEMAAKEQLPILISTMDVTADAAVADTFASIHSSHGPVDVLINNAGIEGCGAVEELPLDHFRSVMETNYFGSLRCIHAVLPEMRERRSGLIINVTSVAGRLTAPPLAAYCASKWALEALSEALAGEMKTFGVRVVLVEPGIIDTAMAHRIADLPVGSHYRQSARFSAMFSGSLQQPVPPSLVADSIVAIAQSESWQLRYLVGPDAEPFIGWRRSLSDEQWIDLNAGEDAEFFKSLSGGSSSGPA